MGESTETLLARVDERLKSNNDMTLELLKIVKGDNGSGLMTKVAILEQHPDNCSIKESVKWLTWGFRAVYVTTAVSIIIAIVKYSLEAQIFGG